MEKCRPDIALLNHDGKVFAAIEIVVTHKPEEFAIAYYKKNQIALIRIELRSETDLDIIIAKINVPTSVDYCFTLVFT